MRNRSNKPITIPDVILSSGLELKITLIPKKDLK